MNAPERSGRRASVQEQLIQEHSRQQAAWHNWHWQNWHYEGRQYEGNEGNEGNGLEVPGPLTPRTVRACRRTGVAPAELSPLPLVAFDIPCWDDSGEAERAEVHHLMHTRLGLY